MTEEEWFAEEDARRLFNYAAPRLGERRRRLIGAAACRLIPAGFIDDRHAGWCAAVERLAEPPEVPVSPSSRGRKEARLLRELQEGVRYRVATNALVFAATGDAGSALIHVAEARGTARLGPRLHDPSIVAVVHDIVGNPFRTNAVATEWRTTTVMTLSRQMYESRDFAAMPILADALQDAGCDADELLAHCRGSTAAHVRGCWAVDRVLGKA